MSPKLLRCALLLGLVLLPAEARGQETLALDADRSLVDRVAAVVGDSIILLSEVQERLQQLRASGAQIPEDPVALEQVRREVLRTLVNEQLVIQAAVQDTTITVPEDRVEQEVEQEVESRIQQFGSRQALTQGLRDANMTMASFRENLRGQIRRQILLEQFMSRARQESGSSVSVSEEEMREFFEAQRASLGERPASLRFTQIVFEPEASDSASGTALARAQEIRQMLVSGEQDFETLAERFSQDPGSAQQGGDLGWFRRGDMVPEFADVVYAMQPGQISPVVKTPFGYHIIRLDRVRGAERKARHILIRAEVSSADLEDMRARAREAAAELRDGASIEELRQRYGIEEQTSDTVQVARDRLDQLPPGYAEAVRGAEEGEVVGPLEWQGPGSQPRLSVLKILEVRDAGAFTFDDVRDQVESTLREQKLRSRILEDLRRTTYVEIRM